MQITEQDLVRALDADRICGVQLRKVVRGDLFRRDSCSLGPTGVDPRAEPAPTCRVHARNAHQEDECNDGRDSAPAHAAHDPRPAGLVHREGVWRALLRGPPESGC